VCWCWCRDGTAVAFLTGPGCLYQEQPSNQDGGRQCADSPRVVQAHGRLISAVLSRPSLGVLCPVDLSKSFANDLLELLRLWARSSPDARRVVDDECHRNWHCPVFSTSVSSVVGTIRVVKRVLCFGTPSDNLTRGGVRAEMAVARAGELEGGAAWTAPERDESIYG
jgi:hypothetical protein